MRDKKVKSTAKRKIEQKHLGSEPKVNGNSTELDFIRAYNWYNVTYNSEDAKDFCLSHLKTIKFNKETISKLTGFKGHFPQWIGWNCRLASQGHTLPEHVWERTKFTIREITKSLQEESTEETPTKVISIQDRINAKASDLIGELEEKLDVFFTEGVVQFDVKKWSLEKGIKPQIAKRIAEHFRPQFDEISAALEGKDKELSESYAGWRKPVLKILSLFIKRIIDHMTEVESASIAVRKPRAKKVKPASVLVSKLKYKAEDGKLKSVDPKEIVGASQLWAYNTKYRNLTVYNADKNGVLSVKGSSIIGFEPASSVTKKLRKPDQVLQKVLNEGKIGLRKIMTDLTTAESKANGRINAETILLRVLK